MAKSTEEKIYELAHRCIDKAGGAFQGELDKSKKFFNVLTNDENNMFWDYVAQLTERPDDWI